MKTTQPTPERQLAANQAHDIIIGTCVQYDMSPIEFVSLLFGMIANTETVLTQHGSSTLEEIRSSADAVFAMARGAVDIRIAQAKN